MIEPYKGYTTSVQGDWIDHNGHMNVAYYVLAFDWATDAFYRYLGVEDYCYSRGFSFFTLDMNVSYLGELMKGDPLRITTQLLAFDRKRIRYFHHMYHAEKNFLAATNECLAIHVNMDTRKSAAMAEDLYGRVESVKLLDERLRVPQNSNRLFRL